MQWGRVKIVLGVLANVSNLVRFAGKPWFSRLWRGFAATIALPSGGMLWWHGAIGLRIGKE
jgi:hypothetical protein